MNLHHQRIILTGAASGIGKALLERLATYDSQIIAVDLELAKLETAIASIPKPTTRITVYACDLGQQANVDALFDHAVQTMGGIDLFVANAGFAYYEKIETPDWKRLEDIYRVNVFSPLYSVEKMHALNGSKPYGVVITTSAMGKLGLPGWAVYASTKAALDRFAEAYRYELHSNVLLTLVYPIATRSNFFSRAGEKTPVPFPSQTPEWVAAAIIRGIERNQREIYPSILFHIAWTLNRILPMGWLIRQNEARVLQRWLRGKKQS
jgi:short-subunit dehydrogenase